MIENLTSHSRSKHDNNILDHITSLYRLKWGFVTPKDLIRTVNYQKKKKFEMKDLENPTFCLSL